MVLFGIEYQLVCESDYDFLRWKDEEKTIRSETASRDIALEMRKLRCQCDKPILLIADVGTPLIPLIEHADVAIRFTGENGLGIQVLKRRFSLSSGG